VDKCIVYDDFYYFGSIDHYRTVVYLLPSSFSLFSSLFYFIVFGLSTGRAVVRILQVLYKQIRDRQEPWNLIPGSMGYVLGATRHRHPKANTRVRDHFGKLPVHLPLARHPKTHNMN
jgi:hypothetical protein